MPGGCSPGPVRGPGPGTDRRTDGWTAHRLRSSGTRRPPAAAGVGRRSDTASPCPQLCQAPRLRGQSTGVSTQMASALRHVSPLEFTPSLAVLSEEQTLVQAYSGPPALGKGGRTRPRVRVPREGGGAPLPQCPARQGGGRGRTSPTPPPPGTSRALGPCRPFSALPTGMGTSFPSTRCVGTKEGKNP